jgi:hypothetical protein
MKHGFRWMGGWVGPKTGLDIVEDKMSLSRFEARTVYPVSLFATLRTTEHAIIHHGEGVSGVVRGLLSIVETTGLLLGGTTQFHILHSVHYSSVTTFEANNCTQLYCS